MTARIGMTGGRHRIDHDGCLPSLKLVHGPDASTWNTLLKLEYLCVVGRNDKYLSSSPEEADRIRDLVAEILASGRTWIDSEGVEASVGLEQCRRSVP
jgi:hypothetical protein